MSDKLFICINKDSFLIGHSSGISIIIHGDIYPVVFTRDLIVIDDDIVIDTGFALLVVHRIFRRINHPFLFCFSSFLFTIFHQTLLKPYVL